MRKVETKAKKKLMIEALEKQLGNVTAASKQIGLSRMTHYDWMRTDREYKDKVDSIIDIAIDFAENALMKKIREGDTTATIFFLKTIGKRRGYIQRQEISTPEDGSFVIDMKNWE